MLDSLPWWIALPTTLALLTVLRAQIRAERAEEHPE